MPQTIDLNADLGEGCPWDQPLLDRVTSASVCCGAHAGDPETILQTLRWAKERRVVVGPRAALAETRLSLGEVNWLGPPAEPGMAVAAKLRSTQLPVGARFYPGGSMEDAVLVLDAPAGAVAPGQAAVLYDGERLLGGGWIRRSAAAAA